jgi:HK97 family phage portal protein
MGLGKLLTRNIVYDVTNTQTGTTATHTIITDGGPGMFPMWGGGHYRGAMGIPAAWRLALLLSNQLGRIPWHAFREVAGRPPVKLAAQPLLVAPAGTRDTALSVFRSWTLDRIWHGNAVGVIADRSPLGYATAVTPVNAEFVQVKLVAPNDPVVGFAPGEIAYLINGKWYHQSDVIHFKGPCAPGELRGLGVLEEHFSLMDRSRKLDASASAVDSGAVPTGLLRSLNPDMTDDEAAALKTSWQQSQQTRSVAVLNPLTEFTPIAWNPTETQLLEARQYSLTEWANVFGIDGSYVGAPNTSGTYANIENQGFELLKFGSVGDFIAEFEAVLTNQFPRGTYVKANLDHLLRADTKTRYEAHAIGISSGFVTRDEVRELEERPPLTEQQKAELKEMAAPAPAANNTPGAGQAPPRLAAVRALLRAEADWWERAANGSVPELTELAEIREALEEVRGYPEFNQHQPRWPKGTGKKAGEWTDSVGGRVPFGAKNPFSSGTWSKGKWNAFEGGAGSFGGSGNSGFAQSPPQKTFTQMSSEEKAAFIAEAKAELAQMDAEAASVANLPGAAPPLGSGPGLGSTPPMGSTPITPHYYGAPTTTANTLASDYHKAMGGGIPPAEAKALSSYTGVGYGAMNGALWSGDTSSASESVRARIDALSSLIDRYELPTEVKAVRGLNRDPNLPPFGQAEGMTYTARGFQSTSVGTGGFTDKNVIMNITAPKGTKAAVVNGTGLGLDHEEEMILPHNTRYVIQSDRMVGGKRVMDVIALPPA